MSGDDLLSRATAALRLSTRPESLTSRAGSASAGDSHAASDARAARTRANVLLAASARGRRRNVIALVWPLAAVLVIATAWAGRHRASERWAHVVSAFQGEHETMHESAAAKHHAPIAAATAATAAAARAASDRDDAEGGVSRVVPAETRPVNRALTHAASSATKTRDTPVTAAASSASSVAPFEANAASLYAAAHRAHFADRDPAAALVAWDAYLAAAPDGTLAPEARYNRGVTLVRLGRYDDARRALAPFAAESGGYRAREAKRLLDAIATH